MPVSGTPGSGAGMAGSGTVAGGRLVGVGVGPGDPELVTVKAVRILREADTVVVPILAEEDGSSDGAGRAETTVRAYVDEARITRVPLAMNDRGGLTGRREAAWEAAADAVLARFDAGAATVAFATIGDPGVYSTFTYLAATVLRRRPGTEVSTVPGIMAMQDL